MQMIALEEIAREAEHALLMKLNDFDAQAANDGMMLSNGRWLGVQDILLSSIEPFSESLMLQIKQVDSEFSPFKPSDLDDCITAIQKFSLTIEQLYIERGRNEEPPPGSLKVSFDTARRDRVVSKLTTSFNAKKAELKQRRSMLRLGIDYAKKAFWPLIFGCLGWVANCLWQVFTQA